MEAFLTRSQARLALSLHATTDEVRDWIAPVNRRHNIHELLGLLRRHFQRGSKERPLLIEYVMLAGVNDTLEDAHRWVGRWVLLLGKAQVDVITKQPIGLFVRLP